MNMYILINVTISYYLQAPGVLMVQLVQALLFVHLVQRDQGILLLRGDHRGLMAQLALGDQTLQ